jgi:hypothetical protein
LRITDIREQSIKLDVTIRNAVFSFDDMTTSIVAVITDVVRGGATVAGFAFNSTGRYACGAQMRDRLIPRILRQDPASLWDEDRGNFNPGAVVRAMMFGEKPGGDLERSVGIGTIEVALWDAMAKIEEKPLHRLIAERFGGGGAPERMFCYVGGGWYSPDETAQSLKDEMRGYLDQVYTLVKAKIGGLPIDDDVRRIETILSVLAGGHQLAVDANCGLSPERALEYAKRLKPHGLRWFEEPVHPIDFEATSAFVEAYGKTPRQPAKTCSRSKISGTFSATADCGRAPTSSTSIYRKVTASACALGPWTWRAVSDGRPSSSFPTAAIKCRWPRPWASASACANPTPMCSARSRATPTMPGSRMAIYARPNCQVSVSRAKARFMGCSRR